MQIWLFDFSFLLAVIFRSPPRHCLLRIEIIFYFSLLNSLRFSLFAIHFPPTCWSLCLSLSLGSLPYHSLLLPFYLTPSRYILYPQFHPFIFLFYLLSFLLTFICKVSILGCSRFEKQKGTKRVCEIQ